MQGCRNVGFALLGAILAATPAIAAGAWHFNFRQGTAEYAVGSFASGNSHFALYCNEGGAGPPSASLSLQRAGFTPTGATPATFVTERGSVAVDLDRDGSARFPGLAAAPRFRNLWRLLVTSRSLTIRYGPGKPMSFSLAGAAELLGQRVCPKQLAG